MDFGLKASLGSTPWEVDLGLQMNFDQMDLGYGSFNFGDNSADALSTSISQSCQQMATRDADLDTGLLVFLIFEKSIHAQSGQDFF
jgi:hypothetical protein